MASPVMDPAREVQLSEPVTPVDPAAEPAAPTETNSLASLHAGRVIGDRYTLVTRIAIGGMGEVWRASTPDGGDVAVKVLRPELAGQQLFLSRLRIEADNASRLHHPNLAEVQDSGEEDGLGWIAMELVEGTPLTQILADNPTLPIDFLLSVMLQTTNALDTVHRAGIVHRDIKPGNLMVTPQGLVKLTDFGISRAANQVTLTAAGMVMGTAQYLPPEQAVGNPASPLGDLYALGVIAYEALAGKRPFSGKRQVDIAFAHVNSPVPHLPQSVPAPLADLVMDLLRKDPRQRPASALAVGDRIEKVMEQLGISFARDPQEVAQAAEAARQADQALAARLEATGLKEAEARETAAAAAPTPGRDEGEVAAYAPDTQMAPDTPQPPPQQAPISQPLRRAEVMSVQEPTPPGLPATALPPADAPVLSDADLRDRYCPLERDGSPLTTLSGGMVAAPQTMPPAITPAARALAERRDARVHPEAAAWSTSLSDTSSHPIRIALEPNLGELGPDIPDRDEDAPALAAQQGPPASDPAPAPAPEYQAGHGEAPPEPSLVQQQQQLEPRLDPPAPQAAPAAPITWLGVTHPGAIPVPDTWHRGAPQLRPGDRVGASARHLVADSLSERGAWIAPAVVAIALFVLVFLALMVTYTPAQHAALTLVVSVSDPVKDSLWLTPHLNA